MKIYGGNMNNNILVVDDEKEIRELLNINLINEGFNVFKARRADFRSHGSNRHGA